MPSLETGEPSSVGNNAIVRDLDGPNTRRDTKIQSLKDTIQAVLDRGVPAFSMALDLPETSETMEISLGVSDLSMGKMLPENQSFGIGSVTKVFVAVTILQILEEQSIPLCTKVSDLLDASTLDGIINANSATVESLLRHMSGIESWEDDPRWIVEARGAKVNPDKLWRKTEPLEYIRRRQADQAGSGLQPGSFSYSNTNFTILGLVVEKMTGEKAEIEIRRRILDPLGMHDTYLEGFEAGRAATSPHRYHWITPTFQKKAGLSPTFAMARTNLADVTATNLSVEWVAGGMVSTARDMVKFTSALRDQKLLSNEMTKAMFDWKRIDASHQIGLGIFRCQNLTEGNWIGHQGDVLGFTAATFWNEETGCVVAVLSNVGTMHTGPENGGSAGTLVHGTDLLAQIEQLARAEAGDN